MRCFIIIIFGLLIIAAAVTLQNDNEYFAEVNKYKDSLTDKDLKENAKPESGKIVVYKNRDRSQYTSAITGTSKDLKNNFADDDAPSIPSKFTVRRLQLAKANEALGTTGKNLKEISLQDVTKLDNENDVSDDDLYKNTTHYENIEGEFSGIQKCHAQCSGNCLEFGVTGNAHCFHE